MKLFLAVPIPEQVQLTILDRYEKLRYEYPYFTWIPQSHFHITISYLGERDKSKLAYIIEAIERSLYTIPPIYLIGLETKIFVNEGIVLYLEFARNKQLETIRENLFDYFAQRENEHAMDEYKPHITISRYKLPSKQQYFHLKKKLKSIASDIEFLTKDIVLYESINTSTNPIYEKIHTFELVE